LKHYDGIIFDLDGTLWDASEATAKGWNIALGSLGCAVSAEDIKTVSGKPFEECVETLLPHVSIASHRDLFIALDAQERLSIETHGGLVYEGVVEGIARLAEHYALFLVSNCQQWYLECFWRHVGLQPYFTDWDCFGASKLPKPKMIEGITHRHGLAQPIYIGDTDGDQRAAVAAQIDFGHTSYGFGQTVNSTVAFSSFNDLVAWFELQ
jgi:phosphoglycolate phosphatase